MLLSCQLWSPPGDEGKCKDFSSRHWSTQCIALSSACCEARDQAIFARGKDPPSMKGSRRRCFMHPLQGPCGKGRAGIRCPWVLLRMPSRPRPYLHPAMRGQLVKAGKHTRCFPRNGFGRPWGGSRPGGAGCWALLPLGKSRWTSGRVQRSPSGTHVPHPRFWGNCPSHLPFPAAQGGRGVAAVGPAALTLSSVARVAAALSILISPAPWRSLPQLFEKRTSSSRVVGRGSRGEALRETERTRNWKTSSHAMNKGQNIL